MLVVLGSAALADDEPTGRGARAGTTSHDPRTILVTAFADQRAVVERTAQQVNDKLAAAVATRDARAAAAYKLLRADVAADARPEAAGLAAARKRAAIRYFLAHDRAELGLLADEARRLLEARQRIERDAALAETVALPAGLIWPVHGTIARRFGPYTHDRSGATLTRRGIDVEVSGPGVEVIAPAAGTVGYAGPIRGLDDGVVIDHGTFVTVIGKLAPPSVHIGDVVEQGTPLGHPARSRVYLEVRVEVGAGGTPIDPVTVLP